MKYSKLTIYSSAFFISLAVIAQGNFANAAYKTIAGNHGSGSQPDGDGYPPEDSDLPEGAYPPEGPFPTEGNYPPEGPYKPNYPDDPTSSCEVMSYNGKATETCEVNETNRIQCFADVVIDVSTQQRVWGKACVSDVSKCLWDGEKRVEACYFIE